MTEIVVATRSAHKLREIREILRVAGLVLLDLDSARIPWEPAEEHIEAFDTFEANALAKARSFAARAGRPVLADDSGICVAALGGEPGVHSKRFSQRLDLSGLDLDLANNQRLLERLSGLPPAHRQARYICVLALVTPEGREELFRGTVDGVILDAPRGSGGFGYDPLFYLPDLGATFAEIRPEQKNRLSHRGRALQAARPALERLARSDVP